MQKYHIHCNFGVLFCAIFPKWYREIKFVIYQEK